MAGIGFELRALSSRHSLAGPLMSLTHATWVSSGPLVLTAVGLMIVNVYTLDGVPAFQFTLFHVLLTYASVLALVTVSPSIVVVTRLVADSVYAKRERDIQPLFVGALVLAALSTGVIGAGVWGSLRLLPWSAAMAAWALSQSVALLWIATIFCGTLRDYVGVTGAFVAGIMLSAVVATALARFDFDAVAMMWTMTAAMTATLTWLAARILSAYPEGSPVPALAGVGAIRNGLRRFPLLAIGGAAGALGVWVDKLVVWSSDIGTSVAAGLVYAPVYDSGMFISFLVIVPALAAFVIHIETELTIELGRFLSQVLNDGTLEDIEAAANRLGMTTRSSIFHLFLCPGRLCRLRHSGAAVDRGVARRAVSTNPDHAARPDRIDISSVVSALQFGPALRQQAAIILPAANSVSVLNGLLTWISLQLGPSYVGMGYLAAAIAAGVVAFLWLDRTLRDIVYLTFASASSQTQGAAPAT